MTDHVAGHYGGLARLLHWVTAACVLTMIPAGIAMVQMDGGATQNLLFNFHRSMGVVIFVLMVLRLANRIRSPAPPLPPGVPAFQRVASKIVHAALYVLLMANPILGWIATSAFGATIVVFGLFGLPPIVAKDQALADQLFPIHEAVGLTVAGLVTLHVAAALYHGIVRRDGVLGRMLRG